MSLKILCFNRSYYPDVTATGQLLTELCESLVAEHGCTVTVISGMPLVTHKDSAAACAGKGFFVRELYHGVEILRVKNTAYPPRSFKGRVCNYLSYFFLAFFASWKVKKADIVVTLTDPPIVVLLGWWSSVRWGIPFVVSLRDLFPEAAGGLAAGNNPLINGLLDQINRFCLRRAARVIALGALMQRRLEAKGIQPERITVITDWADTQQIVPQEKNNPLSKELGLSEKFVVMYAGNIGASSGLEFVLDAAQALQDNKDIVFVFVGEGVMKPVLEQACLSKCLANVRFLPFYPREKVSSLFAAGDVFLVPLKKGLGGFSVPSKVYAVLASAKPYIASVDLQSEVVEITKKFDCGMIALPEDARDLAEKVTFFYSHPDEVGRMGRNARSASASFDRSQGVKNYYGLMHEVCCGKKVL